MRCKNLTYRSSAGVDAFSSEYGTEVHEIDCSFAARDREDAEQFARLMRNQKFDIIDALLYAEKYMGKESEIKSNTQVDFARFSLLKGVQIENIVIDENPLSKVYIEIEQMKANVNNFNLK